MNHNGIHPKDIRFKGNKECNIFNHKYENGLLEIAEPLIRGQGKCIFPKGKNWKKELMLAEKKFHINYNLVKSITSEDSYIFVVKSIERKNVIQ